MMKVPGTSTRKSAMAEPPAGTRVVWTLVLGREPTLGVDAVEDLADDVEGADEVGAAVADEEAHRLADARREGAVAGERVVAAVEDDVGRVLVDGARMSKGCSPARGSCRGCRTPLHHVVLAVDAGPPLLGLDGDEAVHPVGDVHPDGGGGAVVDVQPLVERAEGELRLVPGRGEGAGRAAAGAGDGVQVDVVGHRAAGGGSGGGAPRGRRGARGSSGRARCRRRSRRCRSRRRRWAAASHAPPCAPPPSPGCDG
jgi:hypothetical protein